MPPMRASTVFRIKDVASVVTTADLEQILREKFSPDEHQALVDFYPKVPDFLKNIANDKTESQRLFLEVGDRILIIDVNFYGFTQLYEVKGKEIAADIVAVTGLGGHAYGSWRGKSRGFHTLADYKMEFLKEIAKIRSSQEEIKRPIIFIGHSFGGIVVAQPLVEAATRKGEKEALVGNEELVAATCAVMFFGTPHRGILMEDEFIKLAESFKVVSFYERLQTAEVVKDSENRYTRSGEFKSTLDIGSAVLHLPQHLEEAIPVNADHTNIVKFEHKQDATYEDVVKRVRKYLDRVMERFRALDAVAVPGSLASNNLASPFQEFDVRLKLPFQRNHNFCGRKDMLEKLCHILEPQVEPVADMQTNFRRKTAILHGLGGIGKSQIALEYAHCFSHCYSSIFWIDVDDSSRTAKSAYEIVEQLVDHYATKRPSSPGFEEILKILGIPRKIDPSGKIDQTGSAYIAIKAVNRWLSAEGNRRWLLLIDNHDKVEDGELDKFIPTCDWGSIVVTTRLPDLQRFGVCGAVEEIGAEAGLELLFKSSGMIQGKLEKSELGEAQKIVSLLGEFPLALDQAGAHMRSLQLPFSAFRRKLENGMKAVFRKRLPGPGLPSLKASVFTTWELSFQELSENARHLLHLCAFLSNKDIPEELFCRGKSAVSWIMEDETELDDAIENLFNFSLAKRKNSDNNFWIHPLVYAWTRERLDNTMQRQIAEATITLVASAIRTNNKDRTPDDWIFERRIFSHLNVCQENISKYFSGSDSIKVADASFALGLTYRELGYYKQVEAFYRNAMAGKEKALGKDHLDTLVTVHNIALVFQNQGQYDKALEWHQRSLAGREKAFGKDHLHTLTTVWHASFKFRVQ
ncbi:hypothetical protein RUND412_000877 [Rhizina undulata]